MKTFTVLMECTVRKEVICEASSKKEVRDSPWEHAIDELELDQVGWEVLKVTESG